MAAIELRGILLQLVADPSVAVHLQRGAALEQSGGRRARWSQGANGRDRLIVLPGRGVVLDVEGMRINRATRERLEDMEAQLLMLRDGRGRKVYGGFVEPSFSEQPGLPVCDVFLAFRSLSHIEAV